MSKEEQWQKITRQALVPDQLLPYATLVSGNKPKIIADNLVYFRDDVAIVIGFPSNGDLRGLTPKQLYPTINEVLRIKGLERIIVLSSMRPEMAPEWAKFGQSEYWCIDVPYRPQRKGLALLSPKPSQNDTAVEDTWGEDHDKLARRFAEKHNLGEGARQMLLKMREYIEINPDAKLYSVRNKKNTLMACVIADFSSAHTAFYMLGFSDHYALPSTDDAIIFAILREAEKRGQKRLQLGLGNNPKMRDYRAKWDARAFMPIMETAWELGESGESQAKYYVKEMARRREEERNAPMWKKIVRWINFNG